MLHMHTEVALDTIYCIQVGGGLLSFANFVLGARIYDKNLLLELPFCTS